MSPRHLLIGSGPAAVSAALAIREADPSAGITMLTADPHGYYSRPGLAYWLVKEEREPQLFPLAPADFRRLGVESVFGRAVEIERREHRVRLEDGRLIPYERLLLATGSAAIPLRVPGADLDGVTKLDDLDDARDLLRRSRSAKRAVVVGGGSTALEIVEGLASRGVHVHYFIRKGRYWSDVLSEPESRLVEDGLAERGVEIHHFTELAEVLGERGRVAGVRPKKGAPLPCDLVAVAIGVRPQKQLAEAAGIECGRAVLVDAYLRSSDEDVFAAGDVAEVLDPRTGKRSLEVLWSSALAKGSVAGRNMAAGPVQRYEASVSLNVTRLAGYRITIVGTVGVGHDSDLEGLARGDSEGWRRDSAGATSVEWEDDACRVRLAMEGDRLAGAIVIGEQELSFALQDLLEAGADVSPIAAQLRAPGAPVGEIIERYHREWQARRV